MTRIFQEYEEKFGEKGRSIATLKSKSEGLSQKYFRLQTLKDQLKDHQVDKKGLGKLNQTLNLARLEQENFGPENFTGIINNLQNKYNQLTTDIGALKSRTRGHSSAAR